MDVDEYSQVFEEIREAVASRYPGTLDDLRPPAEPDRIAAAGEQLGITIPDDLQAMLLAADGGQLFGQGSNFSPVHPYLPDVQDPGQIPLVDVTLSARELIWPTLIIPGHIEYMPQSDFLALTVDGRSGLWYEISGPNAGSILYYSVIAIDWSIVRAAPSLENLFLAARDCTRIYGEFIDADTTLHVFEKYGIDTRLYG